jgi:hypothetical protein
VTGGLVGTCVRLGCAVGTGLEVGNAKVGAGETGAVADVAGDREAVTLADGDGLGMGLGVGEGGIIFSQ